jgi:EAL domain-containing protein (putative c-di-GMP-specific phosphodiesterase class I)
MELRGVELVRPEFAKVLATTASREEAWLDLASEVRAVGLDTQTTIIGGVQDAEQARMAALAGFELGQGLAIRPPYPPPSLRRG